MSDDSVDFDVFAIPNFWKSSKWLDPPQGSLERTLHGGPAAGVFFDLKLETDPSENEKKTGATAKSFPLSSEEHVDDGFFKPPWSLEPISPAEPVSEFEGIQESQLALDDFAEEDAWLSLGGEPGQPPQLKTWESFTSGEAGRGLTPARPPIFISEAGPVAFDQLLATDAIPSRVSSAASNLINVRPNDYVACLLALALGRASVLFSLNQNKRSFQQTAGYVTLSGHSVEGLEGISALCLGCGNNTRLLRGFVEKTYTTTGPGGASPSRVALANAVNSLINTIQSELGSRGRTVKSLIQLQAVVRPVATFVSYFKTLIAKLSKATTDEELLSLLFREAHSAEYAGAFLRDVLRLVLRDVSRPWTEFAEEWIGLRPEGGIPLTKDGPGKGFVKVAKILEAGDVDFALDEADFFLDDERMPSFIPEDLAQPLFETGRNLRFIRANHPDHPLSQPQTIISSRPPPLEWHFEWDTIRRVEQKALAYEKALVKSLKRAGTGSNRNAPNLGPSSGPTLAVPTTTSSSRDSGSQFFEQDEKRIEQRIIASMTYLSQPVTQPEARTEDSLATFIQKRLFVENAGTPIDLAPHWSLVPLLSFGPVILAQSRLVNRECMRLLFGPHRLREHLRVQQEFQLLGNGLFCSRLSHALFDPDLDTAERERGVPLSGGVMGLRLTGRDNWPPASSELRLTLMGVLADSYRERHLSSRKPTTGGQGRHGDGGRGPHQQQQQLKQPLLLLPGDISFAVRELSIEEMEKCMDPDSLQALDFLQLSYQPPAPLASIMTPLILAKYDCVFKLLLRVLRMLFVANQLFHGSLALTPGALNFGAEHHSGPAGAGGSEPVVERQFRFEANHFIACVAAYFFDTGVGMPWRRFEAWLDRVQADVSPAPADKTPNSTSGVGAGVDLGPEQLRQRHDEVLDEIMLALLLRKRQQPVLKLLEDIFGLVLRFAKHVRLSSSSVASTGDEVDDSVVVDVRALYGEFRKNVDVFLTVCRGLSEKGGYGTKGTSKNAASAARGSSSRDARGDENTIGRLVLALDVSGYYSRNPGRWDGGG